MNYDKLKADVKEIADIASAVPEKFRDKCFELLLTHLLHDRTSTQEKKDPSGANKGPATKPSPDEETKTAIPVTTSLRVMMKRTGVTMEELENILIFDGGEVHFIKEPHNTGVATGQTEWALLLALKNAIEKGELSTDPEKLRSICQEKGFYDQANYAATLKADRNTKLFRSPLKSQGDAQPLSNPGQDALGVLVKKLAGDGK
jgi:hypothetical protein